MNAETEFRLDYLICPSCSRQFGLATGTGKLSRHALPDPFAATCPQCNEKLTVPKSAIKVMSLGRDGRITA